jgi:hypothetical protein
MLLLPPPRSPAYRRSHRTLLPPARTPSPTRPLSSDSAQPAAKAAKTPGFAFTKKRSTRASAAAEDNDADAGSPAPASFSYNDVANTPGLVVKRVGRVTRSAAKAAASDDGDGEAPSRAALPSKANLAKKQKEQEQRAAKAAAAAKKKAKKAKGGSSRSSSSGSNRVALVDGGIPAYPSTTLGRIRIATSDDPLERLRHAVSSVVANEVKQLTDGRAGAFRDAPSAPLRALVEGVAEEFVEEADRLVKHAMEEAGGAHSSANVLTNPKNAQLRGELESVRAIVGKMEAEDARWADVEAAEEQQGAAMAVVAGEGAAAEEGVEEEGELELELDVPSPVDLEASIAFFARQIEQMRNGLKAVKAVTDKVTASHARMAQAVKQHSFKGYKDVQHPKRLLQSLAATN